MPDAGYCNIVVALFPEARPLIERLRLKEQPDAAPFRLFAGGGVRLIVSGVGARNAAAACGFLHAYGGAVRDSAWLNIGVAGHPTLEIGSVRWAQSVTDDTDTWYPQWTGAPIADGAPLRTVARPVEMGQSVDTTQEPALHDMEGAAFLAVCSRFSSLELVHCLKVVSDNNDSGTQVVTPKHVAALMLEACPVAQSVVADLQQLATEQASVHARPDGFDEIMQRWRFSVTQQRELRRLLVRWNALAFTERGPSSTAASVAAPEAVAAVAACPDARAVLERLRAGVDGRCL